MKKNMIEVVKPENLVIDLLSYVGKFGENNPNKGIYTKKEVETVVSNVINQYLECDLFVDDSNPFTSASFAYELMEEYDNLDNLSYELSNRIYEGLNDLYNPFPERLWTIRKGLNLKDNDDEDELLCDIENEYTDYIIEESGTFDEESGDEGLVVWSVKDVISQIYTRTIEALHIK